jgi:hypothetical protein
MGINKINLKYFLTIIIILSYFLANYSFVFADTPTPAGKQFNRGLDNTAKGTGHVDASNKPVYGSPSVIIGSVIKIILSFLGVLFLILMIYGGFVWMKAMGNEQEVTKAKSILTNAIIGLIIVLAAYAITAYVGAQLATSDIDPTT